MFYLYNISIVPILPVPTTPTPTSTEACRSLHPPRWRERVAGPESSRTDWLRQLRRADARVGMGQGFRRTTVRVVCQERNHLIVGLPNLDRNIIICWTCWTCWTKHWGFHRFSSAKIWSSPGFRTPEAESISATLGGWNPKSVILNPNLYSLGGTPGFRFFLLDFPVSTLNLSSFFNHSQWWEHVITFPKKPF